MPSNETNSIWKEQRLESTTGGVGPPISAFLSVSCPVLQHVAEHCRVSLGTVRGEKFNGTAHPTRTRREV